MVVFAFPEGGRAKSDFGRVCEGKKKAQTAKKKDTVAISRMFEF
jgi:hypothetical protein